MVSVQRGVLFLLVLGKGCVILLWHSLGLPYNYIDEYISVMLCTLSCLFDAICDERALLSADDTGRERVDNIDNANTEAVSQKCFDMVIISDVSESICFDILPICH